MNHELEISDREYNTKTNLDSIYRFVTWEMNPDTKPSMGEVLYILDHTPGMLLNGAFPHRLAPDYQKLPIGINNSLKRRIIQSRGLYLARTLKFRTHRNNTRQHLRDAAASRARAREIRTRTEVLKGELEDVVAGLDPHTSQ